MYSIMHKRMMFREIIGIPGCPSAPVHCPKVTAVRRFSCLMRPKWVTLHRRPPNWLKTPGSPLRHRVISQVEHTPYTTENADVQITFRSHIQTCMHYQMTLQTKQLVRFREITRRKNYTNETESRHGSFRKADATRKAGTSCMLHGDD